MEKDLENLSMIANEPMLFIARTDAQAIVRLMHEADQAMDRGDAETAEQKLQECQDIMQRIKSKFGNA